MKLVATGITLDSRIAYGIPDFAILIGLVVNNPLPSWFPESYRFGSDLNSR